MEIGDYNDREILLFGDHKGSVQQIQEETILHSFLFC